ncbi:autotransporter-associated beta strand repeat-containing protein, partial [Rhizobiaceae sp. 2RAB30]
SSGTVTLGSPITVHNLTFDTPGYVLNGSTLTLAGSNPTISTIGSNTGVVIDSVIAGTAGLTKALAGVLRLNGANTFSGDINVTAGTLVVNDDSGLGASSNKVTLANGTRLTSAGLLSSTRLVTLAGGQASITGAGV